MEGKSLIKQIIERFLRLTVDHLGERSWSRFTAYCKFVKDLGKLNLGQELYVNRFADFEKCCAIDIYFIEMWVDFINVRSEARNDLPMFLRDTQYLKDICILLWLGPALLGIHLTEPYLSLLIDPKATHLNLLEVLPKLHSELLDCASTAGQVDYPPFPSLKDSWIDPRSKESPYVKEIVVAISYCNKDVLEIYLKELCKEMSIILKLQRGNILFLAHFYWSVFIFG